MVVVAVVAVVVVVVVCSFVGMCCDCILRGVLCCRVSEVHEWLVGLWLVTSASAVHIRLQL